MDSPVVMRPSFGHTATHGIGATLLPSASRGQLRGRVGPLVKAVLLLALFGLPAPALATDSGNVGSPEYFQCVGKSRFSGAAVEALETYGDPTGRAYAATLFDPVHGTPLIVYGLRYRQTAPLLRAFIKRHECQHANGVQDEIAANCATLVQMRALGLTTEQETQIARWHIAEGAIDPQYGGSGAVFWERTLRCAGTR